MSKLPVRLGNGFIARKPIKRHVAHVAYDYPEPLSRPALIATFALLVAGCFMIWALGADNAHGATLRCPELRQTAPGSLAYRDTLEACRWDAAHPIHRAGAWSTIYGGAK